MDKWQRRYTINTKGLVLEDSTTPGKASDVCRWSMPAPELSSAPCHEQHESLNNTLHELLELALEPTATLGIHGKPNGNHMILGDDVLQRSKEAPLLA